MYASGLITGQPDYDKAMGWFISSTLKKHKRVSASGLYGLGYLHFTGQGLKEPNMEQVCCYVRFCVSCARGQRPVGWATCISLAWGSKLGILALFLVNNAACATPSRHHGV